VDRVLFAPPELPALRPDVAADPGPYTDLMRRREAERGEPLPPVPTHEELGLIMIAPGEPGSDMVATLGALQEQSSEHWSLLVVLHETWQTAFTSLLAVSGLQRSAKRVRVATVPDGQSRHHMLELALRDRAGSNVALIFPGDIWTPEAVARLARPLAPDAVVYADEDVRTDTLEYIEPQLKPAYSPEFLLHFGYMGRPMALGGDVSRALASDRSAATDEIEHDLALRATERAGRVHHVADVLCHRLAPTPDRQTDGAPVVAALSRRGESAEVSPGPLAHTFRIWRRPPAGSRSSIIIPFRDEPRFLRTCVDSIHATTSPGSVELILVNNGSRQAETTTLLEALARRPHVQVVDDDRPFNWAQLNNAAAARATGELLIFMNNDMEAIEVGWLEALQAQAQRPHVGAVGARLLYHDRRLQHCGVVLGLGGAAGHIFVGLGEEQGGYLNMARTTRECAAVTGACLATRRQVFDQLNGFDETLGVDLNDIDFCLRVQRSGMVVLCEMQAQLVHYESPSRGTAGDVRDIVHFIDRWSDSIASGDPYLNPLLTRVDSSCALRRADESQWWQQWRASLASS
jgi:O-antigen biosynthesis protein